MMRGLFLRCILLALILLGMAGPAAAYPPKPQDWLNLRDNAEAVIEGWKQAVGRTNEEFDSLTRLDDLSAIQSFLKERMGPLNAACGKMRDQIGSGGLFGPEMWTQGYRQTCWAIASLQNAKNNTRSKVCDESKSADRFFISFRPKKLPENYVEAGDHMRMFGAINKSLRDLLSCK
jgi:hypothetical protein